VCFLYLLTLILKKSCINRNGQKKYMQIIELINYSKNTAKIIGLYNKSKPYPERHSYALYSKNLGI